MEFSNESLLLSLPLSAVHQDISLLLAFGVFCIEFSTQPHISLTPFLVVVVDPKKTALAEFSPSITTALARILGSPCLVFQPVLRRADLVFQLDRAM